MTEKSAYEKTIDVFFSIVKENGYQLSELTEEQISEIIDKIIDEKLLQNKNYIFKIIKNKSFTNM